MSNHTARKALDWKTPLERETGDTPDCSHLLHFDFYQPVWFWDPSETKFPIAKRKLGRWLGAAPNVGQALCYYILTICGNTIARSTVKGMEMPLTDLLKREIDKFDREVAQYVSIDDELTTQVPEYRQQEAIKVALRDPESLELE